MQIILNLTEEGIAAFLETVPIDEQTSKNEKEHIENWCRQRLFNAYSKGAKKAASKSAVINENAVTIG